MSSFSATDSSTGTRGKWNDLAWGLSYLNNVIRARKLWAEYKKKTQAEAIPPPSHPTPPSESFSLLGQASFAHPTYGRISPCLVPESLPSSSSRPVPSKADQTPFIQVGGKDGTIVNPHTNCSELFTLASTQRIISLSELERPTYIVSFPTIFASHIRLVHFNGNTFNTSFIWSNADLHYPPKNQTKSPAHTKNSPNDLDEYSDRQRMDLLVGLDKHFHVEWVPGEGLAMKGGFWGMEGPDAKAPEGNGKDGAEVWFEEVPLLPSSPQSEL